MNSHKFKKTGSKKAKKTQKRPQVRKYKTKVSKVWLSRTKNYNIGKGRLTGDFQTSDEETESIRQG